MKRSERLDVVQQAAARTERERAERVGAAERHLTEMQQKLTALEKYRGEYEAGFAARAGGGVDVIGMRDFQTFLAKLGEALIQQRELVVLARKALEAERSHWREAAQRQHVVETLAERWQGEETRAANRRDQIESDELSRQLAAAKERAK
ncbi:MAG TPA: flagellar export protein FliJ [Steroidobacteraceae bacterium]|jgi:flagellar FliJ protein|nr:flagellar export protein FliJ [Steroidobacteraceae bacterium]